MMQVAVVGLGKIGLPLAVQIASTSATVVGLDTSEEVVQLVGRGVPPFPGEADLERRLEDVARRGTFRATTDARSAVRKSSVVVVVVPLVIGRDKEPDFRHLDAATAAIAPHLPPGILVSYETTLPVGTTRQRFAPALEAGSHLRLGDTLFVCHSPERVSSGRVFNDLRTYPKLVGGIDAESARRASAFYENVLTFDARPDLPRPNGVWDLGSCEAAELAKLAETTYRDLNIAFANEVALAAESLDVDIAQVIDACNSQPFSHIHRPGIFVGGHCIPVYPYLLTSTLRGFQLPPLARAVNDAMPRRVVSRIAAALPEGLSGCRAVVLGLAFRGGVKEDAFSGVYPTAEALREAGAEVSVVDPLFSDEEIAARGFRPHHLGEGAEVVVLQADHSEFATFGAEDFPGLRIVYDGRRFLDPARWVGTLFMRIGS